jgi:hypothetical protein
VEEETIRSPGESYTDGIIRVARGCEGGNRRPRDLGNAVAFRGHVRDPAPANRLVQALEPALSEE